MFSPVYEDPLPRGSLIYVSSDFSFDTIAPAAQGITSVLINDINLDFSEDGAAVAVWGVSVKSLWSRGEVRKPFSKTGRLLLLTSPTPGVAIRVENSGGHWRPIYDASSGWIYIGMEAVQPDQFVEFLSGCVMGIRCGEFCGIWLHPEFRDE